MIEAYCHLREEVRSFNLARIEEAIEVESGELISDIWVYFGLPSELPTKLKMPQYSLERTALSPAQLVALRKADKQALLRRFQFQLIADAAIRQLHQIFSQRCFACCARPPLDMDHHIPQERGGRLEPGNIVLLCRECNLRKRTTLPLDFYSPAQLCELQPLLEAELELFDFRFDWNRWHRQPRDYLLAVGVTPEEAEAALTKPDDPLYIHNNPVALGFR